MRGIGSLGRSEGEESEGCDQRSVIAPDIDPSIHLGNHESQSGYLRQPLRIRKDVKLITFGDEHAIHD
jgi:hypothetical protein